MPNRREIALHWNHSFNIAEEGEFEIECTAEDYEENTTIICSLDSTDGWIKSFTVTPVIPFTEYNCSVTPNTTNGHGNPTSITVQTLQDSK